MISEIERKRLIAILGRLGSEHAGERNAAAAHVEAFRRKHNVTWDELLERAEAPRERPLPEPPGAQATPEWKPSPQPDIRARTWPPPVSKLSLLDRFVVLISIGTWRNYVGFLYFAVAVFICEMHDDTGTLPVLIAVLCIPPAALIILLRFGRTIRHVRGWAYILLLGSVFGGVVIAFHN